MLRALLIIFCALSTTLFSAEEPPLMLKEKLLQAKKDSYIVTFQNKLYTLLHIFGKEGSFITIEEVSIPEKKGRLIQSWQNWLAQGAPGNTSWVMYEMDIDSGKVLEYFSFTCNTWSDLTPNELFIATLIRLPLQKIPEQRRRRSGQPPLPGHSDDRLPWQPRMVVEGKEIKGVRFDSWETRWPKDGGPIAGKQIDLYFPAEGQGYSTYFPHWLELRDTFGQAKVRIVDSGMEIHSPKALLPKRPPEFLDQGHLKNGELTFKVKTRLYYTTFELIALLARDSYSGSFVLPHEVIPTEKNGLVLIKVSRKVLEEKLKPGEKYLFVLAPIGYQSNYAETKEPVSWEPKP